MTDGTHAQAGDLVNDVLAIDWTGINPDTQITGTGQLDSTSNFILGNDPQQWHTNVSEFSGVRYANAWNGIDLVYRRSDTGGLEYDFDVNPGADPSAVGFRIDGAQASVDPQGNLILTTPDGNQLVEAAPTLYQVADDGTHEAVSGGYQIRQDGSVGFSVGQYDPGRQLVIDPTLSYTETLGGSGLSMANGVTTDANRNAYVAGYTASSDFPTTTGAYDRTLGGTRDAFVAKISSSGSLAWSTYLGGTTGFMGDVANAVALGPNNNVYVTGFTTASNFPTTGGAYQTAIGSPGSPVQDAFLSEISAAGSSLLYSSFLGGSGLDTGYGVAVDPSTGEAVVVGSTVHPIRPILPDPQPGSGLALGHAGRVCDPVQCLGLGVGVLDVSRRHEDRVRLRTSPLTLWRWIRGEPGQLVEFPGTRWRRSVALGIHRPVSRPVHGGVGSLRSATLTGGAGNDSATAVAVDSLRGARVRDGFRIHGAVRFAGGLATLQHHLGGTDAGIADRCGRMVVPWSWERTVRF